MKKYFLVFFFLLASCGPPGLVVYERGVGSKWHVKEIHVQMEHLNSDSIDHGRIAIEEMMGEERE
jgi:hypothetical protein